MKLKLTPAETKALNVATAIAAGTAAELNLPEILIACRADGEISYRGPLGSGTVSYPAATLAEFVSRIAAH